MADPVFDDVALRRQLEGTTPADYQRRDAEEHALFSLDFGLIPSMRIGHYLFGNGIGSTLLDMVDPIQLFGPELVMKLGSKIAGKLASRATAEGAKTLEEVYKAEPSLKMFTAPMEAATDLGKTTERFNKWRLQGPADLSPEALAPELIRKMPRAIKGREPVGTGELAAIGAQHDAERRWSSNLADQLSSALKKLKPEERVQVQRVAQGVAPAESLRPEVRPVLDEWMMAAPEVGEYLHQNGLIRGTIEGFAPRAFTFTNKATEQQGFDFLERQMGKSLSSFTTHGLKRTILDYRMYAEMEKMGLGKAKEDIAELWPEYIRSVGKAAADKRVLSQLAGFVHTDPEMKLALPLVTDQISEIPREARELYRPVKDPTSIAVAAERAITRGQPKRVWSALKTETRDILENLKQGRTSALPQGQDAIDRAAKIDDLMGNLLAQAQKKISSAWVLKDQYSELKRIWDVGAIGAETGPEKLGRAILTVNSVAKRLNLGFTGFHLLGMLGSGAQALGAKLWRFPRALKQFGYENYLRASDIVEDGIFHGLSVGAPIDAELEAARSGLSRAATWLEGKGLKVAAAPLRGFEHFQGKIDKYLWEYTQNGLKIATYNELLQSALKNPKFARLGADEIKTQVAQHVNQAFGGLLWQRLIGSRQGLNGLRMLMFAPDWTLSNLLMAGDVFSRVGKLVPGVRIAMKDLLAGDVRAYYARQYAFRARLQYALLGNLANYAFTSWKDGKGHFMDENKPGAQNWIELPFNDRNGRPQYYRLGKHLTEMTEALRLLDVEKGGPLQFLKRKLAPVPAWLTTEMFGTDPLGQPLVGVKDGAFQELSKRLGHTAGVFEPMPITVIRRFLTDLAQQKPRRRPLPSALLSALGMPVRGAPSKQELKTRPIFR
jgi:hypothetical protein